MFVKNMMESILCVSFMSVRQYLCIGVKQLSHSLVYTSAFRTRGSELCAQSVGGNSKSIQAIRRIHTNVCRFMFTNISLYVWLSRKQFANSLSSLTNFGRERVSLMAEKICWSRTINQILRRYQSHRTIIIVEKSGFEPAIVGFCQDSRTQLFTANYGTLLCQQKGTRSVSGARKDDSICQMNQKVLFYLKR